MFGRMTIVQTSPDQVDEGTRMVRDQVLPRARELEGFRGVISLADRATGKVMTVTLWETEEAMRATEEAANRLRSDVVSAMGAQAPTVERYEVTLLELE